MELEGRIAKVLLRLSLVSDAAAGSFDTGGSHGAPGSCPPPGVVLDRGDGPVPKELSLFAHYRQRFEAASSARQQRLLCYLAERDLDHAVCLHVPRAYEKPAERESRLLREYAGIDALEVAVLEDCSETYIRKLRRRNGRSPQDGHRVELGHPTL
jgi:hypothetical protein